MKKKKILIEEQMLSFSRRALLIGGLQIGALGLIVKHLYGIQVIDSQKYLSLSDSNRFNFSLIPSSRGSIFDRKGSQNFHDRIKALDNDLMTEITEVQKVLEFIKQESTRSFVTPKS